MRFQGCSKVALNINWLRFGLAILNRLSAILCYCDSTNFCASRCGNSGDSRHAIPESWDSRFCAAELRNHKGNGGCFLACRFSCSYSCQRTPWGGGKKRGVENLTNDTPPKKGFWTPPRTVCFPPLSGVGALFFLYKNPRQSRPEALLEGSKNFRESAFSGTFSSPHTFCTPPYHGPKLNILPCSLTAEAYFLAVHGKEKTMTMTKIYSQKSCYLYGHGQEETRPMMNWPTFSQQRKLAVHLAMVLLKCFSALSARLVQIFSEHCQTWWT